LSQTHATKIIHKLQKLFITAITIAPSGTHTEHTYLKIRDIRLFSKSENTSNQDIECSLAVPSKISATFRDFTDKDKVSAYEYLTTISMPYTGTFENQQKVKIVSDLYLNVYIRPLSFDVTFKTFRDSHLQVSQEDISFLIENNVKCFLIKSLFHIFTTYKSSFT